MRERVKIEGLDLNCGSNIKIYMANAGFVDIKQKRYRVPIGSWLARDSPETKRIGEHAANYYGMLFYHAVERMLRGAGYDDGAIKTLQEESKSCFNEEDGKEFCLFVTVGRKPKRRDGTLCKRVIDTSSPSCSLEDSRLTIA